jgi:hypothetical protein
MKMRIIFTVFTIMMFGVMANAQTHVKVFSGPALATLTVGGVGGLEGPQQLPVVDLVAGQSIRVRTGDVNGNGIADVIVGAQVNGHVKSAPVQGQRGDGLDDVIVGGGSFGHVKTTPIPCRDVRSTAVRKGGNDKMQDYMTITLTDVMVSATDPRWKNTCRLLSVELRDGTKYFGTIKFR